MLALRYCPTIFTTSLNSVQISRISSSFVVCGARSPRPRYPHVWKTNKKIGTIAKSYKLVLRIKELSNGKEEVYGALDSFIAWDLEFPLITVKKALKTLENEKDRKRIIQIITGGVTRMKEHLAGTHKDSKPCEHVPQEVRQEIKDYLKQYEEVKIRSQRDIEDMVDNGSYYQGSAGKGGSSSGSTPQARGVRGPMDRFVVEVDEDEVQNVGNPQKNAKEARDLVCLDIGRFFFENGIAFNAAKSASFINMCRFLGNYGHGLKPPTPYELSSWILKEEVKSTEVFVNEVKKTWAQTGVSILSDGWKDMRGRQLINFFVNNPYGTVYLKCVDVSNVVKDAKLLCKLFVEIVNEVGEDLVIQVVTDNAANYKTAGKLLMEKKPKLWWTPCAAHCIDLMLEKIGELPQHKHALIKSRKVSNFIYNHGWALALMREHANKDLVRPAATRFATAYLTLQSMINLKQPLEAMFTCSKWSSNPLSKKAEGKSVKRILLDRNFWKSVNYAVRSTKPLVGVLRMADSEKVPGMGFLYGSMEDAKKEIAANLGGELGDYKEVWSIIDKKWDMQMHRDLHGAAYFLNPRFQYSSGFNLDPAVKRGYYNCLDKLIPNEEERKIADGQLDKFKFKEGLFGHNLAKSSSNTRAPADWWAQFGDETPELTSFAVKFLSLTASSSACERNWSIFNHIHTKKRNRLATEKLNKLVYVMYNKKLKDRHLRRKELKEDQDPLVIDEVASDDEWIASEGREFGTQVPPQLTIQDANVEDVEDDDSTQQFETQVEINQESGSSQQKRKGKRPRVSSQSNTRKNDHKKRQLQLIDEEKEWEDLDEEEDDDIAIRYDDDSMDDPSSGGEDENDEYDEFFKPLDTDDTLFQFR